MAESESNDERAEHGGKLRPVAWLVALGVVALTLAAYSNSLRTPLLLDDHFAITDNPSIRTLSNLREVLSPPPLSPTAGRPLLNLTFALNFAFAGASDLWSYHLVNVLVHCLAGLTLFGIVRRTATRPTREERSQFGTLGAGLVAACWALHPLNTAAVTYLSQRAESLMGLFYLGTLYGFIRATQSRTPAGWLALSGLACWSGMATKEVMVTAPLMVLFYDRTFVSASWRDALRARRQYYASLALSWLFLGYLMSQADLGARNVGFGQEVSPFHYALIEARVVAEYLLLAIWPNPLVFDYGFDLLRRPGVESLPLLAAWGAALGGAVWAGKRFRGTTFLAGAIVLLLLPTSSVVPIAMQPMAESRMYLPTTAVTVAAVGLLQVLLRRRAVVAGIVVVGGLTLLTYRRNADYRSELGLWLDTVMKFPETSRGHNTIGTLLARQAGRQLEAVACYERALQINPDYDEAHFNLGVALAKLPGRGSDAITHYEAALRLNPRFAKAHNNLANELTQRPGRLSDALAHYRKALRLRPDFAEAHYNLATVLAALPDHTAEAVAHYQAALRHNPNYPEAHNNLANELGKIAGREGEAIAHYEKALQLRPDFAAAHNNLATLLASQSSRLPDALKHFERALEIAPDFIEARYNLATRLAKLPGGLPEAIAHYRQILQARPDHPETHNGLAGALHANGQLEEAIRHLERAVQLRPDYPDARENLNALRALRR